MVCDAAQREADRAPTQRESRLIPGDGGFTLDAVTSSRLSLQAAGVETTTAEVTMTTRCVLPFCTVCLFDRHELLHAGGGDQKQLKEAKMD